MNWLNVLLWSLGGVLGLVGLVLLARALFADRARGRRRCPKCWYDMAGVPGLTCPECGRTARSEKQFSKTRHRWRRAGLSLVVLVVGAGSAITPRIRAYGWVSLLPTEVLILVAPPAGQEWATSPIATPGAGAPQLKPVSRELKRRAGADAFAARQWRLALRFGGMLHYRRRLPAGERVVIRLDDLAWLDGLTLSVPKEISGAVERRVHADGKPVPTLLLERGTTGITLDMSYTAPSSAGLFLMTFNPANAQSPQWPPPDPPPVGTIALPITVVETVDDAITPIDVDASTLTAGMELWWSWDYTTLTVSVVAPAFYSQEVATNSVAVDLLRENEVVLSTPRMLGDRFTNIWLDLNATLLDGLRKHPVEYTIRIRGDGRAALADLDKTHYLRWSYTVPFVECLKGGAER